MRLQIFKMHIVCSWYSSNCTHRESDRCAPASSAPCFSSGPHPLCLSLELCSTNYLPSWGLGVPNCSGATVTINGNTQVTLHNVYEDVFPNLCASSWGWCSFRNRYIVTLNFKTRSHSWGWGWDLLFLTVFLQWKVVCIRACGSDIRNWWVIALDSGSQRE